MRTAGLALALALAITGGSLAMGATPALAPEPLAAIEPEPLADAAPPSIDEIPSRTEVLPAVVEAVAVVPVKATLASAEVGSMTHLFQTLNNCGPASVVMALSTLGVRADQEAARLALRGPDIRRGMGPSPVDGWVKDQFGLRAMWRNNGTAELVKALVSNGFAPMVTQWMEDPTVSRISHWRTVRGYDDARSAFIVNDPIRGAGLALGYDWFMRNWQPFSYRYLVLYRPGDEELLRAIVGDDWSERQMRQRFYERMKGEAQQQGTSASWLALGEAAYGNGLFSEAVAAFEKGLALGSAQGVFTLRSSYPQALRALGRAEEASAVQLWLSGGTTAKP